MTRGGPTNKHGLTPVQEAFCHEYLVDLDHGAAAKRAGYTAKNEQGYKRRGNEALKKPAVQMRIQQLQDQRSRNTDVTAERVVEELARIGFSDLRELVVWGSEGVSWKSSGQISDDAAAVVKEIHETEREMDDGGIYRTKRIQMHDKMAALKELAKHTGVGVGDRGVNVSVNVEAEEVYRAAMNAVMDDIENYRGENEKALPEERVGTEPG